MCAGTQIDRGYARLVIDAKLGEGAMGVVWRAWMFHAPNGPRANEAPQPIAIKQLRPQASVQKEIRAYFLDEAEAMKRLAHPNVVRFYDLFEWRPEGAPATPATLTLAMEYVAGDTLEELIARHVSRARLAGPGSLPGVPFRRAWYYFQQLLGALAATHALGIVHRDVKPSNIMIRRDGIVKLTDYGIARLTRPEAPPGTSSGTELAPGTGAYMSPEQVLAKPLDGRSDLYAAAIVLYEMLCGRPPFLVGDKSEFAIRLDQVETPPPPIRTFLVQAPPVLDALFTRALAKDAAVRFANAIELGEAFRAAFGLPDTPEWRAQAEIAKEATAAPAGAQKAPERAQKLATLRDVLVRGYKTEVMRAR